MLLMKLRSNTAQAGEDVCSPVALFCRAAADIGAANATAMLAKLKELAEDECVICLEQEADTITRCAHMFHKVCMERYMASMAPGASTPCPLCRQPVRKDQLLEASDPPSLLPHTAVHIIYIYIV